MNAPALEVLLRVGQSAALQVVSGETQLLSLFLSTVLISV